MVLEEKATQTKPYPHQNPKFCGLQVKNLLQFISSLFLPLTLGIFTVVITLHQQNATMKQRIEDHELAREQRLEDRNESQHQRAQELFVLTMQHEAQTKANNDRYQDEVLFTYIKEIGELLEKYNGSLQYNTVTTTLARVKTLNAIRQLDGSRNMHIIRFLYESGQLTNTMDYDALDVSTATLIGLDFANLISSMELYDLSLTNVILQNSTFEDIELENVDFYNTIFENVSFSSTGLSHDDFSKANLHYVDFFFAELRDVNFSSADLGNVGFSSTELDYVHFSPASLEHVNFSFAGLGDVDFSSADLENVDFSSAELEDVDFSPAKLKDVDFSSANLIDVNFSSTDLENADFSSAELWDVDFSSAELWDVDFSSTELDGIDFSSTKLDSVDFSFATLLNDVNFALARLDSVDFQYAIMSHTNFVQVEFIMTNFTNADLSMSLFLYANAKGAFFNGADLTNVNFSFANLHKADFTNTSITESQLRSAVSIRDARLPNGTLGRDPNLIKNGHADCNVLFVSNWQLRKGNISIATFNEDPNNCHFTSKSSVPESIISQKINLTLFWNSKFWKYCRVILTARMSSGLTIQLNGMNIKGKILGHQILNSTQNNIIMLLNKQMKELEIIVKFASNTNENDEKNSWCDDIELFLDYDTQQFDE